MGSTAPRPGPTGAPPPANSSLGTLVDRSRALLRLLEPRHTIARAARLGRNLILDLKFGRFLGGRQASPYAHLGAHETANSDYRWMDVVFEGQLRPDDVLVDVGCGWGRVINWWLNAGAGLRIVGLELDPEVASAARSRLGKHPRVTILTGDAVANLPADGTLFYMYNPFDAAVMTRFRDRMLSLFRGRRDVRIVYVNHEHLDVFRHPGFKIEEKGRAGGDGPRCAVVRMAAV